MTQEAVTSNVTGQTSNEEAAQTKDRLGPILCWAVVFADIGTSVYYVPGILYGTVGKAAGFFVFLTMIVFVLLTFKYAEVTYRFPQGGGVVTVAAQALNHWFGALGGMFILVDYFLTSAISSLSGILYLSVVLPAVGPQSSFLGIPISLWITIVMLILLGILNWIGVSESAKVSLVGAVVAFGSDIAILVTVFTHISFTQFLALFPQMFSGQTLTPVSILVGFAGSFLAFSGLESISQLAPVMKIPRRLVGKLALFLVILTVGITSPLLTMLSTLLQPRQAANSILSAQLISLLGGHWGSIFLQTEVAISASALLVFASNTAIIGAYHVFMALARMEFFPEFILQRNKLRGTPHYSIAFATGIPILVLLLVKGNINILGDMYAFGLLGAFTLTCIGMDIVRYRERKARQRYAVQSASSTDTKGTTSYGVVPSKTEQSASSIQDTAHSNRHEQSMASRQAIEEHSNNPDAPEPEGRWSRSTVNFWLGILTTVLVVIAWSTNLIAKPLATAFGGSVAIIGMGIAYINYARHKRQGRIPVVTTGVEKHFPAAVLAILSDDGHDIGPNDAIIEAAIHNTEKKPIVFLYRGIHTSMHEPKMFALIAPHLDDPHAKEDFGKANYLARKARLDCRFIYRHKGSHASGRIWRRLHPYDTIVAAKQVSGLPDIHPDEIRYEQIGTEQVAHLLKQWEHTS